MIGRQAQAAEVYDAAPCAQPGGWYAAARFLARAGRAFVHANLREFAEAAALA
ncbi:hypothetical protein [Streptomyces sp. Ru73]|uniref:hypothetical protein n=1 Tax=Streptomyces sp. Ru73 TaxID=2080748 RepID=UPI0015E4706B|nr:hypothetical protein [Streptomyces sp. Ru73]